VTDRKQPISEAERDVLKALWEHGPATVREVNDALRQQGRRWAHTTVITLLSRLETKGYVSSDKSGFAHVFRATVSREEVVQQHLSGLAEDFCEGESTPLLLALFQGSRFSSDELEQFRQLIDQLDAKRRKTKPSK
jgi:BlaI family transcriptional regulator, penicillinase repressor